MWFAVVCAAAHAKKPAPIPAPPPLDEVAATLIGRALVSDEAYRELAVLCDDVGNRIAGSPALDRAIAWGIDAMTADGLANVRREPVTVPVWVRGEESGQIVTPEPRELHLLGLGGTLGTPAGGIEADVLVVSSFDELAARSAEVPGKIVLFDVPFTNYGETVGYRWAGPPAAAEAGAVAALVRSVSPVSLDTPHTGMTQPDAPKTVPAAAVTLEDATHIHRLVDRGKTVRVHLSLGAHRAGEAPSANVVGEVVGRDPAHNKEIVVLGCHLDSWDVGQGAQDDGAGCATVLGAADLIRGLPVPPRRTVRVVLYTNEESGLAGGKAYAEAHASEPHAAAFEVDTGAGQPLGFHVALAEGAAPTAADPLLKALAPVATLLAPIGAGVLEVGHGGADIGPLAAHGVPLLGLAQDTTGYWPIHHTEADTFDKIDPVLLGKNVATAAVMAYALAELDLP